MKKTELVAAAVCAFVLSACGGEKTPAPGASASGAPVAATSGKALDVSKAAANTLETTSPLMSFATVQYDRATPNFINPCFFIIRGIRTAALQNEKFSIDYSITYTSGGQQVTKTVTTKVSESEDHVHDMKNPDEAQYVALADKIDVTGQLPDAGTTFSGTATLFKESGGNRVRQIETPVK